MTVNFRAAARNFVGNYNPTINYRALVESSGSREENSQGGRQSSEDDYEKAKRAHDLKQQKLSAFESIKSKADFKMGHPNWIAEIEDQMTYQILDKIKFIAQDFGVLSILLFVRLFKLQNMGDSLSGE